MKNKCCINGCGERGQWVWYTGIAYCDRHKPILMEKHAGSGGRVHEGRKVGKPKAWKVAQHAKGVQAKEAAMRGVPSEQVG